MVSMVDWTRFTRGSDLSVDATNTSRSRYHQQRERETIRQAEEHGYFILPSKSFLQKAFAPGIKDKTEEAEKGHPEGNTPKDLGELRLIQLSNGHLRNIGDIGMCRNLRICVLAHNYIKKIDGLAACDKLVKLDLSHNQLSSLPGASFWGAFGDLQILHLHDNPIGRIESLSHLSSASTLTILTLFDTPLSLKRNYRHHVVNSIWSLKALDNHVISDEEIIEDAAFGGPFSSQHPALNVNLTVEPPLEASYEDHMVFTYGVIAAVNRILAHHSPVLIIQRHVRAFLVRKLYKTTSKNQTWSARSSHKKQKSWKQSSEPAGSMVSLEPPPSSPTFTGTQNVDVIKIDYDTYLQNQRPGSNAQSEGSLNSRLSRITGQHDGERMRLQSSASSSASKQRTNLYINLTKLQTETLQILQDDAVAADLIMPTEASLSRSERPERKFRKKKHHESKVRKIKTVKEFFGPVVNRGNSPEAAAADDEEIPIVQYRLRGFKKSIEVVDPTTELIIARRDAGKDVRLAEYDHHIKMDNEPKVHINRNKEPSSLRKLMNRNQNTMGLSCLRAVQQAYKDREKMENQALKMEYVLGMKEQRETAKERIKLYAEEKRNQVLRDRAFEQKRFMEDVDRIDMQRISYLERTGEMKGKTTQQWKLRRGELTFMTDFNVQNTSVSNALMRHDRQAVHEDKMNEKSELVQAHKSVEKEQQEIVKKYLEHRQLMRQAEVAMSRAALDTKMLQEANDRLLEARSRVAQQKAKTANVQAMLTFPSINTPSLPPMTKESKRGLEPRPIFSSMFRSTTVA